MAEKIEKPEVANEKPKKAAPATVSGAAINSKKSVGLVEMMLILMLVGLVFIFIFPLQKLKEDKAAEALAQQKVQPMMAQFKTIIAAMEEYRQNDPFGEFPFTIEELNLDGLDGQDFKFGYDGDAAVITATSKEAYGKADILVKYDLKAQLYSVEDPTPEQKPTIKEEWLF